MARQVSKHGGRTIDNEKLTIINVWEENTGKAEIKKQLPYTKTYEVLVNRGAAYEFIQKRA